jgi:hypothetical protein
MSLDLSKKFHELFEYKDGFLYWKVDRGSRKLKGKKAGRKHPTGYVSVKIRELGKEFGAHRIVFCMHHGYLPKMIDHINLCPSDNRLENLRECTASQNQHNKSTYANSTTGVKNVTFSQRMKKYKVEVAYNSKTHLFGFFEDLELAELVATEARNKYHGAFANHGVHSCLN